MHLFHQDVYPVRSGMHRTTSVLEDALRKTAATILSDADTRAAKDYSEFMDRGNRGEVRPSELLRGYARHGHRLMNAQVAGGPAVDLIKTLRSAPVTPASWKWVPEADAHYASFKKGPYSGYLTRMAEFTPQRTPTQMDQYHDWFVRQVRDAYNSGGGISLDSKKHYLERSPEVLAQLSKNVGAEFEELRGTRPGMLGVNARTAPRPTAPKAVGPFYLEKLEQTAGAVAQRIYGRPLNELTALEQQPIFNLVDKELKTVDPEFYKAVKLHEIAVGVLHAPITAYSRLADTTRVADRVLDVPAKAIDVVGNALKLRAK